MKKYMFSLTIIALIILVGLGAYFLIFYDKNMTPQDERDLAIQKAQEIYKQLKAQGVDFSNGPCIAEELMPGWVADIAHNPRQAVDNLPENQCQNFRNGKAQHFVELDPEGNVIRAM